MFTARAATRPTVSSEALDSTMKRSLTRVRDYDLVM
jgi:hypothetical protein